MKKTENIPYASDSPEQLLDLYLPEGPVHDVFVYFHGGGMEQGDKYRSAVFAPWLTERGVALISANYRMYPNAVYPDFIRDAALATAWAKDWIRENADGARLFVGGSSAGGYLSMMLCFDRRYLADVGMDNSRIAGYFHDAGQPTAHFNVLAYSGVDGRRVIVNEMAPLYYVGLEERYPPMRFIISDHDIQNRLEQTMLLLSTLRHFGYECFDHVLVEGKHCAYCKRLDEKGDSVFAQMIYDFIRSVG